MTDGRGNPRIGWGSTDSVKTIYFARLDGEREWRRLGATAGLQLDERVCVPSPWGREEHSLRPRHTRRSRRAVVDRPCRQARTAVAVQSPAGRRGRARYLHTDRRLLGVRYDVERPYVWYADPKLRELIDRLDKQFRNRVHDIIDSSDDKKTLLIQASSPVDLGTYYIYDVAQEKLQKLGTAYPELDQNALGWMTNIVYKATDGTEIPGYLSVPLGAERKNLPLIVMPHDGPVARDSWKFSFLRTFLVNRGYAVLQMNYRGSDGLGQKWRLDGAPAMGRADLLGHPGRRRAGQSTKGSRIRSASASWVGDSAATPPC